MHLKTSSGSWRLFCLGLNVLMRPLAVRDSIAFFIICIISGCPRVTHAVVVGLQITDRNKLIANDKQNVFLLIVWIYIIFLCFRIHHTDAEGTMKCSLIWRCSILTGQWIWCTLLVWAEFRSRNIEIAMETSPVFFLISTKRVTTDLLVINSRNRPKQHWYRADADLSMVCYGLFDAASWIPINKLIYMAHVPYLYAYFKINKSFW